MDPFPFLYFAFARYTHKLINESFIFQKEVPLYLSIKLWKIFLVLPWEIYIFDHFMVEIYTIRAIFTNFGTEIRKGSNILRMDSQIIFIF